MATNTFLTASMITNEALFVLKNQLSFTRTVNRSYDKRFGVEGAKIGTILNVRKPPRYLGREGSGLDVEAVTETSVPVALNTQFGVDLDATTADFMLSIDNFSERIIKPAVAAIANRIDHDGLKLASQTVANFVGAYGTVPADIDKYLEAKAILDDCGAPVDGRRYLAITPKMEATVVYATKGLFQSSERIKEQYEKGRMGVALGWDWAMDQNCPSHKVGNIGTTAAAVNGAGQTGSELVTDTWTAGATLKRGDIIQIAGVYHVNPQNRESTGRLAPFVVTKDCTADGDGNMTISIWPAIVPSGAFQTVDAAPADGALISVFGKAAAAFSDIANKSFREGLGYHRDAFTLACADLPLPNGVDMAARAADEDLGLSIRLIRAYDVKTDKLVTRLDVLYGWAALRPELAVRILS